MGDPTYVLPDATRGKKGIDYRAVTDADNTATAVPLGDHTVLLIGHFGGDGAYAVYGEYEDGEFMRLCVDLDPIELPDEDES